MPNPFEQPPSPQPEEGENKEEEKQKKVEKQEKKIPENASSFEELAESVGNVAEEIDNKMVKEILEDSQSKIENTKKVIDKLEKEGKNVQEMAEQNNPVITGLLEGIPSGPLRKKGAEIILNKKEEKKEEE